LVTSGEVRDRDLRCVIDAGGEVHIFCTLVWGYERGGRFVCSMLTLEATISREVHSRCSRMLDYERAGS